MHPLRPNPFNPFPKSADSEPHITQKYFSKRFIDKVEQVS